MTVNENAGDLPLVNWPPAEVVAAATRPLGPGRTVWLASFPKSGNTWMRAIITALRTHRHLFAVNQLGSGSQPHHVGSVLPGMGLDPRWLDRDELQVVRDHLIRRASAWQNDPVDDGGDTERTPPPPIMRKTHEVYRTGPYGREPFPTEATRAAILIVRDPRDVACSHAPFFGMSLDDSIDAMGTPPGGHRGSPIHGDTPQPWGTWSGHTHSWLDPAVPFAVFTVRYEDLKKDALATLFPVFNTVGLECTTDELRAAIERASFDRLKASEEERGFRETSRNTAQFFRKGRAGGWQEELTPEQVAALEADHRITMRLMGYGLTRGDAELDGLAEVRASRRRQKRNEWLHLPEHMGITVTQGAVPESLPGAKRPRAWIQVTADQALVRFAGGAGLLVEGGKDVTVQWQPEPGDNSDPSWLIQGWAVTLAMLQRGDLSLHAATLQVGDKVIALAGHRGAGKSTTSMGLRQRGHRLLIDDVTLLEFRGDEAWTTPYSRNVHLLPDAAAAVGLDFEALPLLAGGRTKVAFRAEDPPEEPHKIDHIIVLAPGDAVDSVTVRQSRGASRVTTLTGHARRDGIAPLVLGQDRYFSLLTKLANAAPVWVVRRPAGSWTLDEVLDQIEAIALTGAPRA